MLQMMVRMMWYGLLLILIHHQEGFGEEDIVKEGSMRDWFDKAVEEERSALIWTSPQKTQENYSYTTTMDKNALSWLITSSVDIMNKTNAIHVDMEYKVMKCDNGFPCNLTVYIYEGKDHNIPAVNPKNYLNSYFKLIHVVKFLPGNKTKTRFKFSYSGKYITFGIRARAVNAIVYGMKMFYYYCKETFIDNIYFPKTISPAKQSKSANGNCSANSISTGNETEFEALCLEYGNWTRDNSSSCSCVVGFEPISSLQGCKHCSPKYFKSIAISNNPCIKCPEGNQNNNNHTGCICEMEKYRETFSQKETNARCFGLPSKVRDLSVKNATVSSVILKWREPSYHGGIKVTLKYEVYSHSCSSSQPTNCIIYDKAKYEPSQCNLSTTSVIISDLKQGLTYKFIVYSKNMVSKPVNVSWRSAERSHTLKGTSENGTTASRMSVYMFIIVGAVVFLVLLLLIFLIVIVRLRRKKRRAAQIPDGVYEGLALPTLGQKVFIDPTFYDDPEAALKDFANEIDSNDLHLERVLGGGEFGDVYKGTMSSPDGKRITVAAKTLKHDSDAKSRKNFLLEASAMGQFDDPNVICLKGVITKTKPHMIITEYMLNGSLDIFLKQNEEQLTDLQMIGMARGVASGMKYLAAMHFVHRDLAARNILVSETLVCKVADFGLSRELETADSSRGEYCTSGGLIPVRWTAPEAITYRKFSTASDVWSYGILLWEIMSFAERPYWDWENYKVLERVEEGFRLPRPRKCPKALHELMTKCWEKERNQRPQFVDIVVMMDEWIRSPETINNKKLQYRNSVTSPEMLKEPTTPIKDWLDQIRLNNYMPHFTAAGYKELSDLAGLLDNDLREMGITLIGHRNKMLRTIRSLPITNEVPC